MQITNNKYNTMPEQVQENKNNIKSILAGIKEIYSTTETLTEQSETIAQSLTTVPRETKKGFLIDAEANLFNILSVVENVVYIKYMTNVKGVQGEQGVKGEKGDKGDKGDKGEAGTGFTNITDINLVVGEPNVVYDTEDGITITSQGELITDDAQYTPTVEQNIPLIAGNGLTMDATEDGQHVDIHLSAETQSNIARSLKTPISTPTSTKIIAVDNTNSQELLGIGTGLEESNGNVQVAQSLRNQVADNVTNIGNIRRTYQSLVPVGSSIPANADLNSPEYLKIGNHFCRYTKDAATLLNCPTQVSFLMTVYSPSYATLDNETTAAWVYRIRKILTYQGDEYVQYAYSGQTAGVFTYSDWKQIITSSTGSEVALLSDLDNLANKDLSNVTYPQIVADGVAKTGVGDRVIKSFVSSDGLAWYRVWASGWKECGAEINTQSKEIYFPDIEFSTTNYVVTGVGMNIAEIGMQSITKYEDRFVTASAVREIATFSYYACGY